MSSSRHARAFLWTLVAALVATEAVGARLQNQTEPQPTFRSDANYVRVDVYPTANGLPVTDLTRDDFEVLEDNRPQVVEAFEHVVIRGSLPQELRTEPNTVAQSRAMLDNPRARVFVVFLDINHVEPDAARSIRQPLVNALNRMIGPDDLIAVVTPGMSSADLTFGRRTTIIEGILAREWGERGRVNATADPTEQAYQACYPGGLPNQCVDDRGIADQMILRRREKLTLDTLDDLVQYLGSAREERKALLVISDGWLLYRPDASLSRSVNKCQAPGQPIGIDPRTGRLGTGRDPQSATGSTRQCETDRMALAAIDDYTQFQFTLDRANRANVSFYPIDPRGLVVFDTAIDTQRTGLLAPGQTPLPPPITDAGNLRSRQGSLRDLAAATDGTAILNTNDLDGGLRRIGNDLSSYYLLAYHSTGKLDGKFHAIRVRVKRPGVQVRARRGYLAAPAAAVTSARPLAAAAPAPSATDTAMVSAVASAIGALGSFARDARVRVSVVSGLKSDAVPAVWVVGEFGPGDEWRLGADVDLMLTTADGRTMATTRQRVVAGSRSFRVTLSPSQPAETGDYVVRVRAVPLSGAAEPLTDTFRIALSTAGPSGALLGRRGPATANRTVPTADLRFRRNEQLNVDVPDPSAAMPTARLLDRTGKPMAIPVVASVREDADGTRWISAQVILSPLGPGDYVIEVAGKEAAAPGTAATTLIAFRVIP